VRYSRPVTRTTTYLIELGVGLACIAIAISMWQGTRRRTVADVVLIAGLAATGHAVWRLVF
jgi:hypothetical protein